MNAITFIISSVAYNNVFLYVTQSQILKLLGYNIAYLYIFEKIKLFTAFIIGIHFPSVYYGMLSRFMPFVYVGTAATWVLLEDGELDICMWHHGK